MEGCKDKERPQAIIGRAFPGGRYGFSRLGRTPIYRRYRREK